jgi:uncharacterized protein YdaU (DUF1376 family)
LIPLLKREPTPPAEVSFRVDIWGVGMHFYQFHIGDYKSHTHHLSLIEDLAFRRLLDHYYLHEAPIKQRDIARQIGMRDNEQEVLTVLNEFFVSTEQGFINPRADEEISKYRKFSEDGKKGAAKRWHKDSNGGVNSPPNATPIATNNQEPITNNHKPIKERATSVACPQDVSPQVWQDWLQLRKSKKASVTETVVKGARAEAGKLGWELERFLVEWCTRGSQGLKAEWVNDKSSGMTKTGQMNQTVMSGLTRGLIGGGSNVKLLKG